ncbi:hypothetical protein [uncultured Nostoc sp.]|uniref:hypothetical protein n=1 Tax=uncultured Nostoc sp. TaxID=340711 RepID=UPI0035CC2869
MIASTDNAIASTDNAIASVDNVIVSTDNVNTTLKLWKASETLTYISLAQLNQRSLSAIHLDLLV